MQSLGLAGDLRVSVMLPHKDIHLRSGPSAYSCSESNTDLCLQ
jgi:hypothetical protein